MKKINIKGNELSENIVSEDKTLWEALWEFIEICKKIKLKEPEEKHNI